MVSGVQGISVSVQSDVKILHLKAVLGNGSY